MTWSGCAFGRPADGALPVNIHIREHRSHLFQSFRRRGSIPSSNQPPSNGEGGRPRHPPLYHPSGGDGCQGWSSNRKGAGSGDLSGISRDSGHDARPVRADHQRGRRMPVARPQSRVRCSPSGRATKREPLPFFTRRSTLCFPSVRAFATTEFGGCRNRFAGDLEDYIAGGEAMVGGNTVPRCR